MGIEPVKIEARSRGARMLRTAMGASISTGISVNGKRCEGSALLQQEAQRNHAFSAR